ncbi:MAG: hypothetical protein H8D45_09630 [Bacteroidetes bacterium]|nr:hypothetical protein [Bacteroidota bacterium]
MIKNRQIAGAGYGTHITPLIASVLATRGDVMEMGMGDYSTPLLHEIIKHQRETGLYRNLISFENDAVWYKNFIDLQTDWHIVKHIKDWSDIAINNISVLFIDHAPASRRIVDIFKFKDAAEIIVVHDTEKSKYYGYNTVFSKFQYRFDYERYSKKTTLVSNFINVTKIL